MQASLFGWNHTAYSQRSNRIIYKFSTEQIYNSTGSQRLCCSFSVTSAELLCAKIRVTDYKPFLARDVSQAFHNQGKLELQLPQWPGQLTQKCVRRCRVLHLRGKWSHGLWSDRSICRHLCRWGPPMLSQFCKNIADSGLLLRGDVTASAAPCKATQPSKSLLAPQWVCSSAATVH